MRKDEHGDGGAHFHGTATRRGVVGDFVAHDFHDVAVEEWRLVKGGLGRKRKGGMRDRGKRRKDLLSICDESENDGESQNGDLPKRNRKFRSCCISR